MKVLLVAVLTVVAIRYLLNQSRKPTRWIGRYFLTLMNVSHSALTDWGLKHVPIENRFRVLDLGCGGGRTIEKMAAVATEGRICGVDYSDGGVAASRARNAAQIRAGRVEIRQASVSRLPFPDGEFDLVTAVETHYYWPDLVHDMREVHRVVKPGGTMVLIAESYKGGKDDRLERLVMRPLKAAHLSAKEHRDLFEASGFSDVQVFEERDRGWICVTGRRSAEAPTGRIPTGGSPTDRG